MREYEIKALMVNDLRMIMMSSRRRSQDILATLERKLFQEDFYYGSSPTTQDLIDAYDLALEALVGSNTPAPFDSPTLSSNSENFDIWWELAEQTSGDNMRALYGRKQIKFLEYTIQGALTSSNVYARFSLEYVAVSISSGTGDHANAVIDIEGGVLGKTVISHNLDYHSQHQPVSHYWIELGNYGTEEEPSPWLAINLYAEDSGYPTNPPPEAPPDENMLMQAKLKCSFKNLLLFMHNWDLLKPEVFGIPSDKGLKQIEGVS